MMKKLWVTFAGIGLLVLSQMAFSSDEESLRMECHDQAVLNNVPEADLEVYIEDCMQNADEVEVEEDLAEDKD